MSDGITDLGETFDPSDWFAQFGDDGDHASAPSRPARRAISDDKAFRRVSISPSIAEQWGRAQEEHAELFLIGFRDAFGFPRSDDDNALVAAIDPKDHEAGAALMFGSVAGTSAAADLMAGDTTYRYIGASHFIAPHEQNEWRERAFAHKAVEDAKAAQRAAEWKAKQEASQTPPDPVEAHLHRQKGGERPPEPQSTITPTPFVWRDPKDIPRRAWLYGTSYVRGFVSCLIAPGATGKSGLALVEAVALATGKGLLGIAPPEPLRVWYVNLEDPFDEIERRLHGAFQHYGVNAEDLGDRMFTDSGRDQEVILAKMERSSAHVVQPVFDRLVEQIIEREIDVLIIDPFIKSHRVAENDNNAIDVVANAWAKIASLTNCAILLVHHSRKTGGGEVTAEHARGASSLVSAARSGRVLNVMTDDEAQRARVTDHRKHYFRISDDKANMAPPAETADWYRIVSTELPNGGGEFEPGDNIGVVTKWEWPSPLDDVNVADLRAAQKEVSTGRWRENSQSKEWVGIALAKALDLDVDDPGDKAKIKSLLKTWTKTGMFKVVEAPDKNGDIRKWIEVGEWAND